MIWNLDEVSLDPCQAKCAPLTWLKKWSHNKRRDTKLPACIRLDVSNVNI